VFAQSKHDYLRTTIAQMDKLESRVIDYVTERYSAEFSLHSFPYWYQTFGKDGLDSLENVFKEWLIAWFEICLLCWSLSKFLNSDIYLPLEISKRELVDCELLPTPLAFRLPLRAPAPEKTMLLLGVFFPPGPDLLVAPFWRLDYLVLHDPIVRAAVKIPVTDRRA
jgi:hypothetical protein